MTDRTEIPNRRPQALFDFPLDPLASGPAAVRFTASLGFVDRQAMRRGDDPMEVFLSCNKSSTAVESLGRDAAVLISLLRQYGCPFDVMRTAITRNEDPTQIQSGGRAPAASLIGRLLDEIETFTREEAMALASTGL